MAVQKPFLTPAAIAKHVAWASANEERDCNTIIWTDKSTIELGKRPGPARVTRRPGEEMLPECIQLTFHSGRKSLMVWGAIAHDKKGPLILINMADESADEVEEANGKKKKRGRGLNGPKYVSQVLRGPLKDFVDEMEVERGCDMLVVEDGALRHRSKVASAARSELAIKQLTHPPKSPDLNPIEPVWHILKTRIAATPESGNSLEKLWEAAQEAWNGITEADIAKFTGTMDDRVRAVQDANGWHTRY